MENHPEFEFSKILRLSVFSGIGMAAFLFLDALFASQSLSEKFSNVSYVLISLATTSMWAVWRGQEAMTALDILKSFDAVQRKRLNYKRERSKKWVKFSTVVLIISGFFITFGSSIVDATYYKGLSGAIAGILTALFIQHTWDYFDWSNYKADILNGLAQKERARSRLERMRKQTDKIES